MRQRECGRLERVYHWSIDSRRGVCQRRQYCFVSFFIEDNSHMHNMGLKVQET